MTLARTYVLVHGSWHGAWAWARVADQLRALGHRVFCPTFTGMGDRAHLMSKDITMDVLVQDIVGTIETEELEDVILVGHSLGGVPTSGAADRIPERLRHLVYLDSIVLESGQSAFSTYPPEEVEARTQAAERANGGLAVPNPAKLPVAWGLQEGTPDYDWVTRRLTPTPLRIYTTALHLEQPVGAGLPRTYVRCVAPKNPVIDASAELVRGWSGWRWIDLPGPHEVMITDPKTVSALLLQI
jgi:pimeloyl-ACP methyl ester carboxylesterase